MNKTSLAARNRTLTLSLVSTGLSLAPAAYVTFISNSLVLFADLLRCLVEFIAIVISFIISRITRPENLRHYNYGFGKLEHFSSLVVAGAMLVTFLVTSLTAVQRLFSPTPVENAELGYYLSVLSVLGNGYLWNKNALLAKKQPYPITVAQSKLFRSKTFACVAVVASLSLGIYLPDTFVGSHADAFGAMAVAGFLLYSSYQMVFHSLGEILDGSLEEGAQLLILRALVKFEASYTAITKIRSRRGGEMNYVELWLEFNSELTLAEVAAKIDEIKDEIERHITAAEVIIVPIPNKRTVKLN